MSDATRVLLVDDHATMRMGFRMILEASGIEVVGEAATGLEATHAVASMNPDVVCMDVQMPDLDGIEATRRILAATGEATGPAQTPRIIIVTTFDRDDYLFAALEAGASGFLLKNAGPEELVNAVRVVASGDALLAPEVTKRVIERFAGTRGASSPEVERGAGPAKTQHPAHGGGIGGHVGNAIDLTERETEVLRLLARAMSNAEIASELFIGDATVKTHVSNILLKLGARDRVAAVVWAHRHGYA